MRPTKLFFFDMLQLITVCLIVGATLGLVYTELYGLRSLDAMAQELVATETPDQLTLSEDAIRAAEQRMTEIIIRATLIALAGLSLALLLRSFWKSYLWSRYAGKLWTARSALHMFARSELVFGLLCLCCVLLSYLFLPIALPAAFLVLIFCCWIAQACISLLGFAMYREILRSVKKATSGVILVMLLGCLMVLVLDLLGVLFILSLHGAFIFPLILSALVSHGIRHLFTKGGIHA